MIIGDALNKLNGKKCLVTGGTGMIGRQVVDILKDAGAHVTSVSLDSIVLDNDVVYLKKDLTNFQNCKDITKDMDFVFHVAGIKGSINVTKTMPASSFVPLIQMNTNVLEACRMNGVKNVVYTSSIGAYASTTGDVFRESDDTFASDAMDLHPGLAKRVGEMQIQAYKIQHNLDYAIVRPANIFGPGDNFDIENAMFIPSLMAKIDRGDDPVVVWGDGTAIRDIAYSRDIAEGIILACIYGTDGFVNLGSGHEYTIKDVVETMQKVRRFEYTFDDTKPKGFHKRVMDIEKAKKLIHYKPTTSLFDGLSKTWEWYLRNKDENNKRKNYFNE